MFSNLTQMPRQVRVEQQVKATVTPDRLSSIHGMKHPRSSADSDDHDLSKRQKQDAPVRYACPFYLYDRHRYLRGGSCGHGWDSVHRMKEHLYRRHVIFACHRCFSAFEAEEDLKLHMRATKPCTVSETADRDARVQGINQVTMAQLKTRKRGANEEAKWFQCWDILFPNCARPSSPYLVEDLHATDTQQAIAKVLQELKGDLTTSIHSALGLNENQIGPISTPLKEAIGKCMNNAIKTYAPTTLREFTPAQLVNLTVESGSESPPPPPSSLEPENITTDWEKHQDTLRDLYVTKRWPVPKVKNEMARTHDFRATQYRQKFEQWKWPNYHQEEQSSQRVGVEDIPSPRDRPIDRRQDGIRRYADATLPTVTSGYGFNLR
ncbi:uncharacterized protein F4822DRAFT_97200 [Hypoxylon trugodes]|uniref:uncharacterized protein n=1 Tax=Hypoxylon trugodes TaxID=326681 RepID=UPI002190F486|nr:uncharacterized protein F4822DRAFT_97200 [Hypoxylon trugodes]KAI1382798.1 hypothetical protein F4822DRAFT_97200 [Hypoxylon trugodes]